MVKVVIGLNSGETKRIGEESGLMIERESIKQRQLKDVER